MSLDTFLSKKLLLNKDYYKIIYSNVALCLVHQEKWLKPLLEDGKVPAQAPLHENLSGLECQLIIASRATQELKPPWSLVTLVIAERRMAPYPDPPKILDYFELMKEILEPTDKDQPTEKIKVDQEELNKLYPSLTNQQAPLPAHLLPMMGAIDLSGCPWLVLVGPAVDYTLSDCIRFSPALLHGSSLSSMFVLFQLATLAAVLPPHASSITISQSRWLRLISPLEVPRPMEPPARRPLKELVSLWVKGSLSNLEYLLELNQLAGRETSDPHHPAVIPWVTDFSQLTGESWRDLSKSKYRLNKGDRHLDFNYESSSTFTTVPGTSNQAFQVPHHLTEPLSDITYYVYRARNLSKSLLCRHVRSQWVPAEYPVSIQRLQEWTPDECIPEFFTDPSIFQSIHSDMADLGVPSWCSGPEDFVEKHRELLESVQVSRQLHLWIDLVFGYRLQGLPAVHSKNVYLSLVDDKLSHSGMVQLFREPHPQRQHCLGIQPVNWPPQAEGTESLRPETCPIFLPENLNPVKELEQLECSETLFPASSSSSFGTETKLENSKHLSFYVLLGELVLSQWLPPPNCSATLSERYRALLPIISSRMPLVPSCYREILEDIKNLSLTPPHLLLQPLLKKLPFPEYFPSLYDFLRKLHSKPIQSGKVFLVAEQLPPLLSQLTPEGVELLLPAMLEILPMSGAVTQLFGMLAPELGPQATLRHLVGPICQLYDQTAASQPRLYHRTFLLQLIIHLGLTPFFQHFCTRLLHSLIISVGGDVDCTERAAVAAEAAESVLWLAHRLGPLLTARHLTRPLLGLLSMCYVEPGDLTLSDPSTDTAPVLSYGGGGPSFRGDERARKVIECLCDISSLYGEPFFLTQYLPYIEDQVALARRRLNDLLEAGIIGGLQLIAAILPFLSDITLMDILQDPLSQKVLVPLLRLNWPQPRVVLHKWMEVVRILCQRIGPDMAALLLSPLVSAFFAACKEDTAQHEMAYLAYIYFYRLIGGPTMEQLIKDNGLSTLLESYPPMDIKTRRKLSQEEFRPNVSVVGNRLDVVSDRDSHLQARSIGRERHLKGNWLAYWQHELGRSEHDTAFSFKQILLQNFAGHSGSVRSVCVLDNENSFLTGSKDKTAKVWSLRSNGTSCQWTYPYHRKSVFSICYLPSLSLAGSCDTALHIWDPFLGSCLKQLDVEKGSAATALVALPPSTFVAASTSSTLKFLDARTLNYQQEFRVALNPAGLIRCVAAGPCGTWLAVGLSSGHISVLDVRTGRLLAFWGAHDSEILQLKVLSSNRLVSSSLDNMVAVWNSQDGQPTAHFKGVTEPVVCLNVYGSQIIAGTTVSRIYVHNVADAKTPMIGHKLKSDHLRGNLTCIGLLPLNRQVLLGSDTGALSLSC